MSTAFPGAEFVGRLIDGKFPLVRPIGGTDSSSVFLTEFGDDPKRKSAIKFVSADDADAQARIAQWERAKALPHEHLVSILDCGRCELDGKYLLYVLMEYAEEVLSEILPERALTPEETREMVAPVLDALAFLHGRNLVHGGLKPSNILVVDDRLKLSADGIVAAGEMARRAPSAYDAPETGTEKMTPAADVWSLGMVLVQALTRQLPAWSAGQGEQPDVPESIPEPFFGIARECLRVDAARRLTLGGVEARLNGSGAVTPVAATGSAQPAAPVVKSESAERAAPARESAAKPTFKANVQAVVGTLIVLGVALLVMRAGSRHAASGSPRQAGPTIPPVARTQSPAPTGGASEGPAVKGEVASRVLPEVPAKIAGGIRGHIKVGIRVHVDAEGNVVQASIDSAGPSHYFADQALKSAQKWKFRPAWIGGRTVASVWILHFRFSSSETEASADEESP